VLLDQRRLPAEELEVECRSAAEVAEAIRTMVVRGAPAIGIAAAYGYALAAALGENLDAAERALRESRPTAVNLGWALDEMRDDPSAEHARAIHREEVERCRQMAAHAAGLLGPGTRALTHCNAGGLATGGYGSAVGALHAAWERGLLTHVWVDETRPLLQGARLTAWELKKDHIPATLLTDNMVGHFMKAGAIDCVVVGTDRTAANGDVANKIGTYTVAVLAHRHGIPFYVAAPTSSIDLSCQRGSKIPIEERDSREVTHIFDRQIAPSGIKIANPAFDVTPHDLVTAIITERGIARPPYWRSLARIVRGEAPRADVKARAKTAGKRDARAQRTDR